MTNGCRANGSDFDRLNPTASEWAGLSASTGSAQRLRRVVDFGGRVCGGKGVTNGWETDKRMENSESLNPLIR